MCAVALQALPLARAIYSTAQQALPQSSVVYRLIIGSVAALGAFDAVSGASTTIRSPNNATGTVGQAFSYEILVGPRSANRYYANPLPDGLYLQRNDILGTPTTIGATQVKLTASDGSHSVSKWITIYVEPPSEIAPPSVSAQPQDEDAVEGETTTFLTDVLSTSPAAFQWFFNGTPIVGATNQELTFVNTPQVFVGEYLLVATNVFGAATSQVARLFQRVPLVDSNAVWTYLDTGRSAGTLWRKLKYRDTKWTNGPAAFGYGWGDEGTVVRPGLNPLKPAITTYFRHKFVVADSNAYAGFKLDMQVDDGAVAYLNGKEIWRFNLPARGAVSFRKLALANREMPVQLDWVSTNFYRPLVLTGTNILAVEVHQAKTNGADMRFNVRFSGLVPGL